MRIPGGRCAIEHPRVDPEHVFLLGHGLGTDTIAAIYPRFAAVARPAGTILLDNAVGESDGVRIEAPTLIINPGKDEIVFQNGSMNPVNPDNWTVHLEGKSAKGLPYTLDGKIEHLGWGTRSIVGTWTQGTTKGDFRIQRQR